MRLNAQPVGCLLIGETMQMRALRTQLSARGVFTALPSGRGDLLNSVQEGLHAARTCGGVCVAAEGEMWAAALALTAQLCVERVTLIAPTDGRRNPADKFSRQIERLKGYARRNLTFCVSEILVLESAKTQEDRRINAVLKGLINARVHRLAMDDQRWTNCEQSQIEAAARFLEGGDLAFTLAK